MKSGQKREQPGSWRQELMQRSWRGAAYRFAFPDLLTLTLTKPRTTSLGMAPSAMLWVLPHWSLIEKIPSAEALSSLMTPGSVKLTHKTSQYKHAWIKILLGLYSVSVYACNSGDVCVFLEWFIMVKRWKLLEFLQDYVDFSRPPHKPLSAKII